MGLAVNPFCIWLQLWLGKIFNISRDQESPNIENIWNPTAIRCNKLTVLILKPIESFNLKKNQVEVEEDEDKIGKRQVLGALRENERR